MAKDLSSVRIERLNTLLGTLRSREYTTQSELLLLCWYNSERTLGGDIRFLRERFYAKMRYSRRPIDLIPDFIPFMKFSDDLAAIVAVLVMAQMYVDDEVKRLAHEKIDDIFGAGTSAGLE